MPNYRLGELFCGPGGLALAATTTNVTDQMGNPFTITHQWANDFDESTCETYRNNICPNDPDSVIHGDVKDLNIPALAPIDALAFGFPCNSFSQIGEHQGLDNERFGQLYYYGVKVLNAHNPLWFLAENVSGISSANEGKALSIIANDLAHAGQFGYRLYPNLYRFEEYGVPQARHRMIIVGIRADLPFDFQIPSTAPYVGVDVSCRNAIENPPIPANAPNNNRTRQNPTVVERLQHIRPGENAWTANLPEHLKLNVKGAKMSSIYKRLDPTKPAYTVTGSGGGGTHMYHWREDRALTNRERARLQTFPDDYVFTGSNEQVRKQIGMAVPPAGASVIFEAILKTFAGIPYPSIPANITIDIEE